MIPVKLCGITNLEDALLGIKYGVAALGFILAPSKRQVTPARLLEITRQLPPFVTKIGVFVDEDPLVIREIMRDCRLDLAQLHGAEPPEVCEALEGRVIKAFRAGRDRPDPLWNQVNLRGILIDSFSPQAAGGTGTAFDWSLFESYRLLRVSLILAGGLNPVNLRQAVQTARPDAVDVSSGVEIRPGVKDGVKVKEFLEIAATLQDDVKMR